MAAISYKQTGFAILEVLKKYSDEDHRLRQQQIIDLVEQDTGLVHARKSIRKDLNELVTAGYPLRFDKGWYYEHEFCPAELNLIVDSLRTAAGITASQRDELIRKISRLGGDWYAKDENNPQLRPNNPQFLYALDVLHEAIDSGKKVLFYYGNYGVDKQLHYRCREDGNPRDYLINPYHILTTNGRYYLVCNVDKYDTIAHFRIERIMDIQLTDQPIKPLDQIDGCENGIDVQRYINDHPYMYNGKPKKHTFQAKATALNAILKTSDPAQIKEYGRLVQNFNSTVWNGSRSIILYRALLCKFTQNTDLRKQLLATQSQILVEGTDKDMIFANGIKRTDPDQYDMAKWKGQNLLGFALMQVRTELSLGKQ